LETVPRHELRIVVWPGTDRAQTVEVADESFGGIGLIVPGRDLSVGVTLDLMYNSSPLQAVVRNCAEVEPMKVRVGCEWVRSHNDLSQQVGADLRGGVYLIDALYGKEDWLALGRAVVEMREQALRKGLSTVATSAERLLDSIFQPGVKRAYERLLDACVAAVAQAEAI